MLIQNSIFCLYPHDTARQWMKFLVLPAPMKNAMYVIFLFLLHPLAWAICLSCCDCMGTWPRWTPLCQNWPDKNLDSTNISSKKCVSMTFMKCLLLISRIFLCVSGQVIFFPKEIRIRKRMSHEQMCFCVPQFSFLLLHEDHNRRQKNCL